MGSAKRKTAGRKKLSLGKQTVKDLAPGGARSAKGGALTVGCAGGNDAGAGIADPKPAYVGDVRVGDVKVIGGVPRRCADGSARWVAT